MTNQTTNQDLQRTGARVLTNLLSAELPEVNWSLDAPGDFTQCFVPAHLGTALLIGQATSHQAVRDWAEHLDARVELCHGTTPDARAIVDGIVVRVWCAPEYRDDLPVTEA